MVLSFEAAGKPCARRMICNKTQTHAIMAIVGDERFAEWPGHAITLSAGVAPNGKPTLTVTGALNGK